MSEHARARGGAAMLLSLKGGFSGGFTPVLFGGGSFLLDNGGNPRTWGSGDDRAPSEAATGETFRHRENKLIL